jgi:hypothetical protein
LVAIAFGIEHGKVTAEDFVRRVALESLCAAVPCGHPPLGVEHEDGVILDGLHQETKRFRFLASGEIANERRPGMGVARVDARNGYLDGKGPSVAAERGEFDTPSEDARLRGCEVLGQARAIGRIQMGRDEHLREELSLQRLTSEQLLRCRIECGDSSSPVHPDHGIDRDLLDRVGAPPTRHFVPLCKRVRPW